MIKSLAFIIKCFTHLYFFEITATYKCLGIEIHHRQWYQKMFQTGAIMKSKCSYPIQTNERDVNCFKACTIAERTIVYMLHA